MRLILLFAWAVSLAISWPGFVRRRCYRAVWLNSGSAGTRFRVSGCGRSDHPGAAADLVWVSREERGKFLDRLRTSEGIPIAASLEWMSTDDESPSDTSHSAHSWAHTFESK
jgi:hypothetical protein